MKVSILIGIFSLLAGISFGQTDSALIEKIKSIDVSLNSVQFDDENLYLPEVSFQSFYDELTPYGEWIMITKEEIDSELTKGEGQGYSSIGDDENFIYVWQPSNAGKNWKPYVNGKWEYTEQGWIWVSEYNWGWGPYHYGRWMRFKEYGWVWMPGYVWSPAWVMWRVSDTHVGWVPLSPRAKWSSESGITEENYRVKPKDEDWVFVQKSSFTDNLSEVNVVGAKENKNLISKSKTILNLKGEAGRIFNSGPEVREIEKSTGRSLVQKNITSLSERNKTVVAANEIKVYRERFSKLKIDAVTGKPHKFGKPKKFKKSPKVRKLLKRKHFRRR
jgi:uncharacterized protein DUF6600